MDDIIPIGGYRQHPTALSELYMQLCIISHATMAMASKHPLRFNEFISLSLFRVHKDPLHYQKELVSSLVVSSRPIFFLLW